MSTTAPPPPEAAVPPPTSKTSLATAKTNLRFLLNPGNPAARPGSLTTRSTLRTVRYVAKFVFWRLLRYFKYTAIAAGCAALAGTTLGAALPAIGALIVPSVPVAATIGLTTAVIKFGWRHRGNHFRQAWLVGGEGRDARKDEERDAEEAEREFSRPSVHRRAADAWKSEETFA